MSQLTVRNKYLDNLYQSIPQLTHHLAVALSAECAMRAYIAWEYYDEPSSDLYNALELAWEFACTGEMKPELQQSYERLIDLIQPYKEEPDSEYHILLSIISVIELTISPIKQKKCVIESLTAVIDTANCIDREHQDEAEEEVEFQLSLFKIAKVWGGNPITRNMFEMLGNNEPQWVSRVLSG